MFKRFPSLYVEIDDFSLTYPADRYDEIEKAGAQGWLSAQGRGEVCDTLASFKSFKASFRLIALLTGDIRIPYLNLDKPRIFAHSYNDGQANWDIIKMDSEEEEAPEVEEDDDSFLSISLGKISLTDHPHIVFTDSRDTLFALLRMKKMEFEGKIANRHIDENKIGLQIDSLIAAGRIGSDTLAFNMQNLSIREKEDLLDVHMEAKTLLATQALGRLNVPILLDGSVGFPEDSVSVVHLENFNADIATVPIQIDGDIRFHEDGVYVGADAQINQCNLNGLLKGLAKNIVPESDNISTDALLTFKAHCDGKSWKSTLRQWRIPILLLPFPISTRIARAFLHLKEMCARP
jgi:hypothetical protein